MAKKPGSYSTWVLVGLAVLVMVFAVLGACGIVRLPLVVAPPLQEMPHV